MNKDKILELAKAEKDERESFITEKAHRLAGNASILVSALLALLIIMDGYIANIKREYDFITVSLILVGIGALNNAIFSGIQLFSLNKKHRIIDLLLFGGVLICSIGRLIWFFMR